MELKIERNRLRDACRKAVKAAMSENAANRLPELSGILIQADADKRILRLTCTELTVTMMIILKNVNITESGSAIVPAALFTSVIATLHDNDIEITINKFDVMVVKSQKATLRMKTLKSDVFPAINIAYPENTITVTNLAQVAKKAIPIAAEVEDKPSFEYVRVNFSATETTATASDAVRFVKASGSNIADGEMELVIPKKALQLVCEISKANEDLYVGTVSNKIVFMASEFVFTTTMLASKGHNVEEMIKRFTPVYGAVVDAAQFHDAVNAASCTLIGVDNCINLTVMKKSLRLFINNENGEYQADVNAAQAVSSEGKVFHYRQTYLYDFLKNASGTVKIEIMESGLMKLSSGVTDYIVSPRSEPKIKAKKPEKAEGEEKTVKKPRTKKSETKGKPADKAA